MLRLESLFAPIHHSLRVRLDGCNSTRTRGTESMTSRIVVLLRLITESLVISLKISELIGVLLLAAMAMVGILLWLKTLSDDLLLSQG